ncbi:MAG: hypothetical protein WED04_04345 [Promethearchaeati archaeon SRVP18_Atabeyarchaeia-1]
MNEAATKYNKRVATMSAAFIMIFSAFAVLSVFAPWLTVFMRYGVYQGMTFDYSGLGFATGSFTLLGYSLTVEAVLLFRMAIAYVVSCFILGIVGVVSLYLAGGRGKPIAFIIEFVFAAISIIGIFLGNAEGLIQRLGFIDFGGSNTGYMLLGWGFCGEILVLVSLLVALAAFWLVPRSKGGE